MGSGEWGVGNWVDNWENLSIQKVFVFQKTFQRERFRCFSMRITLVSSEFKLHCRRQSNLSNMMNISGVYAIIQGMKQSYGERLAAAIRLKNLKQADLADELNITQAAVSKIINGTQYLDFDLAVKACKALDISLDWLACGTDRNVKPGFHRNPERQRIEYLLSIINEAEYPLVIVAMEEIIEIRLKDAAPGSTKNTQKKSIPDNQKRKK